MAYNTHMRQPRDRSFTDGSKVEAVRLPLDLSASAKARAKSEDITFSQLMRRAIRRELGLRTAPPRSTQPATT